MARPARSYRAARRNECRGDPKTHKRSQVWYPTYGDAPHPKIVQGQYDTRISQKEIVIHAESLRETLRKKMRPNG